MTIERFNLGGRHAQRITVQPGATRTLTLNSDHGFPATLALANTASAGGVATAKVSLLDGGIQATLGINATGTLAPGESAVLPLPSPVRSITVSQAASANGPAVLEVLQ